MSETRSLAPETLANGRYTTETLLGSGGMGIVLRAHDEQLDRAVAIKLLADNLSVDADARERFAREARAAASLSHPNVVHVYDVGEHEGRPFIVMEALDGGSLADELRRSGALAAAEVERIARQMLAALAEAHAAGLLHRDLKPANVLRADDGSVRITDFGVAEIADIPRLTRTGMVIGTMPYLAPERLRGEPASAATDLFALGATLLELLTGAPPDQRHEAEARTALATAPRPLAALIGACLASDVAGRPADAEAARRLLDEVAATREIDTREIAATLVIDRGPPVPPHGTSVSPAPAPTPAPATAPTPSSAEDGSSPQRGRPQAIAPGLPDRALEVLAGWQERWQALPLGHRIVIGVLVLALMIALFGGSSAPPPAEEAASEPPTTSEAPVETDLQPGDDALETARRIRDFLQSQAGEG